MRQKLILSAACLTLLTACSSVSLQDDDKPRAGVPRETCKVSHEQEIAGLFTRWNQALQTGNPRVVVDNYAARSVLLPTMSNQVRVTRAEKEDYFRHFLKDRPAGRIDFRQIEIGCNSAVDAGLYTFTFAATGAQVKARYTYTYSWNGQTWLITSHHSSALPEKH